MKTLSILRHSVRAWDIVLVSSLCLLTGACGGGASAPSSFVATTGPATTSSPTTACHSGEIQVGYLASSAAYPLVCGAAITKTCVNGLWDRNESLNATCAVTGVPAISGSPVVLYTDIASGPNTGGENNKGIYLSVFGKNFGGAGLGTAVKVYINDIEVDNYRYLGFSKGRSDIQQITVQIGALGNPTPGSALPIKVVVNGAASNTDKTFIVNPGHIYFVSLTGSDSNTGTISSPYRYVQKDTVGNNGPGCSIAGGMQPMATTGVWGIVRPGDFMVMRGGTWTDSGAGTSSGYYYFLNTQNKSGTAPTGAVDTGPISLIGYPTEDVFINNPYTASKYGGAIRSADSARQSYGCGAWITIADLRIEGGNNEGVITTEAGSSNPNGSHWRVVNNELSAATAVNNIEARGAGIAGNGVGGIYLGNYIHDIYCGPDNGASYLQNHGFYFDSVGDYEVAYNHVYKVRGGNGISLYASGSNGPGYVDNVNFHHNIIHNIGKHAINVADGSRNNLAFSNNLIYDIDLSGIRFNTTDAKSVKVYNNTFYNTSMLMNSHAASVANDWNLGATAVDLKNNIFVAHTGTYYNGGSNGGVTPANGTITNNLWFGGIDSYPSLAPSLIDSHPLLTNPSFVTPGADFHLQAGSPAIDAGSNSVSGIVHNDFDAITVRPIGVAPDIGAFERK